MIMDLETALVNRLAAALPMAEVLAYPAPAEQYTLTHPCGAVLVGYSKSTYGAPEPTDLLVQTRKMTFKITVLARELHSDTGAYRFLEAARTVLAGWKPGNAHKVVPVRDRFVSLDDGVWRYALTVSLTTIALETAEPEPFVTLQRITLTEHLTMENGT
ncbi:hypothetical protein M2352_004335 [Azospirillum fermentarium]|uniref:Gp37 family protein n=1 Tax=Azospirillum fermentarium TaxID=1233114 RepID=UPI0022268AD9|nr:Gp37 family protein [Azospirillum fermentarium]MCW2248675.1 hypothetical protein [Azospirillum fermentarium]